MANFWKEMQINICKRNGVAYKEYKCFKRTIRRFLKNIPDRECWELFYKYSGLERKEEKRLRKLTKEESL